MNASALHTASNEASHELAGYLEGMGVRGYFDHRYGLDLVKTHKTAPLYYQRIVTDCALQPTQALIIDDNPQAIAHAQRTSRRSPPPMTTGDLTSLLTLLQK
jgi:FMN phosphatase YigB (HAD superfamily)